MMEKITILFLMIALILTAGGCASDSSGDDDSVDANGTSTEVTTALEDESAARIESYGYVVSVKRNGFVASINEIGYVYIRYDGAKDEIELYDTVIVEYSSADLIEKNGLYMGSDGEIERYSYQIKEPRRVRVADPSKGEPVFG